MAKQVTRWSPDTCSCIVDYEWDDSLPSELRAISLKSVIKKCPDHSACSDSEIWMAITEENPRKNQVIKIIQDTVPELDYTSIRYNFDDKRVLNVRVPEETVSTRKLAEVQAEIAKTTYSNKVSVAREATPIEGA